MFTDKSLYIVRHELIWMWKSPLFCWFPVISKVKSIYLRRDCFCQSSWKCPKRCFWAKKLIILTDGVWQAATPCNRMTAGIGWDWEYRAFEGGTWRSYASGIVWLPVERHRHWISLVNDLIGWRPLLSVNRVNMNRNQSCADLVVSGLSYCLL